MTIYPEDLIVYDELHQIRKEPGTLTLMLGFNAKETQSITLTWRQS
jgi:hypothetical protein